MNDFATGKAREMEKFARYDTADYLETEADMAAYLTACAEANDPALFVAGLVDVAHALGLKITVQPA